MFHDSLARESQIQVTQSEAAQLLIGSWRRFATCTVVLAWDCYILDEILDLICPRDEDRWINAYQDINIFFIRELSPQFKWRQTFRSGSQSISDEWIIIWKTLAKSRQNLTLRAEYVIGPDLKNGEYGTIFARRR
jgi:hypothetical protein